MEQIYDEISEVKGHLKSMYSKYDYAKYHVPENHFICVMKSIYFIKDYLMGKKESYYNKSVVYDTFRILDSFRINSITNYHQSYRSLIENIIRSYLSLDDDDSTGVYQLFAKFEKICEEKNARSRFEFFKAEYGKACDFVHSNINSNIKKELFFSDFLSNEKINKTRAATNIIAFEKLLKDYILLIVETDSATIDNVFYRKKPLLSILIGKDNFALFESKTCLTA